MLRVTKEKFDLYQSDNMRRRYSKIFSFERTIIEVKNMECKYYYGIYLDKMSNKGKRENYTCVNFKMEHCQRDNHCNDYIPPVWIDEMDNTRYDITSEPHDHSV